MKKFLAILLAMMLVMVSVAAMADDPEPETPNLATQATAVPTVPQPIKIQKVYKITLPDAVVNDTTNTLLNNYTLSKDDITFTVTSSVQASSSSVEEDDIPAVEVVEFKLTDETPIAAADIKTDDAGNKYIEKSFDLTINIPAYSEVGIYEYQITEVGNYTGVGYHNDKPFYLRVTVTREKVLNPETNEPVIVDGVVQTALHIAGIALRETNADDTAKTTKIDTFGNTYGAGRLAVTKEVGGNMGDRGQDFEIEVKFESEKPVGAMIKYSDNEKPDQKGTLSLTLDEETDKYTAVANLSIHHGEIVQFENIPAGVTYTVTEDTSNSSVWKTQGYETPVYDANKTKKIAAADDLETTVKNNKSLPNPDTGITLETLPYVLMMVLAMMGLVALKLRKREEY